MGETEANPSSDYFGISPQTFPPKAGWKRRYDPRNLKTLEGRSRRPKRVRQPTWSLELAQAVLGLREEYPRWGKDKLVVLLRREGRQVSVSMVGRILGHLKTGLPNPILPKGKDATNKIEERR